MDVKTLPTNRQTAWRWEKGNGRWVMGDGTTTGILKCEANALKIIFLLKKCVTITFSGFVGTKLSIQMYPLLGYNEKVPKI